MPDVHGRSRGDLHVVVRVAVPEKLNERQRKAIEELAAAFGEEGEHPIHLIKQMVPVCRRTVRLY